MRKVLALLLSLVMTLTLLVPATWAEEKPAAGYQLPASLKGKTVILHTNDVHGAIDKYAQGCGTEKRVLRPGRQRCGAAGCR